MKLTFWLKSLFSQSSQHSRRFSRQRTTLRRAFQRHGNQSLPAWVEILETRVLLAATVGGDQNVISSTASAAVSVFAADIDEDGDMDALSASRGDDKIAWYENNGSQSFTAHTISTTRDKARRVFAADVDGDGDMDVLSASQDDSLITWYENDGSQNFTPHTISTAPDGALEVFAADMDGDADLDVLSASRADNKIAWYENDGSGSFTAQTISTAASGAYSVFVADVDGDGNLDVLSASRNDNKIAWYENLGNDNATLTIDDVSKLEDGIFTFTITSNKAASADITVVVDTADIVGQATAGSDYTAIVNQTATIATGSTSTTVTVTVNDDAIVEDNQTFAVNLMDAKIGGVTDATQVVIGDGAGIATIENNDTATLTISHITEMETDTDFTVQATVTLSAEVEGGFDVAQ
jgi:hypothetical protein